MVFLAAAPIAGVDPYELQSSLITLTYGEIANSRVLAERPPYWRRLAAIAQASMIARCIVRVGSDATQFIEWAKAARIQIFWIPVLCGCAGRAALDSRTRSVGAT